MKKYISIIFFLLIQCSIYAQTAYTRYIVKKKDTVYSIAKHYGISIDAIYKLNSWAKTQINVGDQLILPIHNDNLSEVRQAGSKLHYLIKNGDTMYSICHRFGITQSDLIKANPGLSPSIFPAGRGIEIPSNGRSDKKVVESTQQPVNTGAIKMVIALPFQQNRRYIDFYEGFLIGLNEIKKTGVSVDLNVVDISNLGLLQKYQQDGLFSDKDIVVGGTNIDQITTIAKSINKGYYIVPFNGSMGLTKLSSRLIQINMPYDELEINVIPFFLKKYKYNHIAFIGNVEENESIFVTNLKKELDKSGIKYSVINITNSVAPSFEPNTVLVPINKSKDLFDQIMGFLPKNTKDITIFGYPLWQSFDTDSQRRMAEYNTTIFSSFFFNPNKNESTIFLNKFKGWYHHPIIGGYPKYSIIGYDLAKYFISNYHLTGGMLNNTQESSNNEGLQMDFIFKHNEGWQNQSLYFITYNVSGTIICHQQN